MTAVFVVPGHAGTRDVLRSLESASRQTAPVDVVRIVPAGEATPAAAFNDAMHVERADRILLLAAPWRLVLHAVERCGELLDGDPDASAVVPALRVDAVDGRLLQHMPVEPTLPVILASPLTPPPVVLLRRELWDAVGPLDATLGELAWCEWWLRCVALGRRVVSLEEPLARLTAGDRAWWPPHHVPLDTAVFRRILEKHQRVLDRQMTELVVSQEIRFGRLLDRHRAALRTRDDLLARLDALRAETAHHHAFLRHHGRSTLDWGDLRRTDPVSRDWGYDRGIPIDRRYIEDFLAAHSSDIRGRVLEVQEDDFTRRFGGPKVAGRDVVDVDDTNPRATVVADLRAAAGVADGSFDAIILTQTLHVIDDMAAVLAECRRVLAPGGVLLATLPAASRVCLEYGEDGDLWRVTPAGARALFDEAFHPLALLARQLELQVLPDLVQAFDLTPGFLEMALERAPQLR